MQKQATLLRFILLSGLGITALPAHANVIQYFFGNNYKNPAALGTIPRASVTIGATGINPMLDFKGTTLAGTGSASSNEYDVLPYFYGGIRLSPDWVVGLNISHPFYGDQRYGTDSIVRYDATTTRINTTDINPQVSYQLMKNLIIGAGVNFTQFNDTQLDVVSVIPGIGSITDKSSAWYRGWDVGLLYTATPVDYIGLSYFSALPATTQTGTSSAGSLTNDQYYLTGAYAPATTILSYTHVFNPALAANVQVSYSQWSVIKTMALNNMVGYGTFTMPLNYNDTIAAAVGARYAFRPDWAVLGALAFDQGAATDFTRSVQFPNDNAYIGALGLEHNFCKGLSGKLLYSYVYADTRVDHTFGMPTAAVGDIDVRANVLDLSLTYKI